MSKSQVDLRISNHSTEHHIYEILCIKGLLICSHLFRSLSTEVIDTVRLTINSGTPFVYTEDKSHKDQIFCKILSWFYFLLQHHQYYSTSWVHKLNNERKRERERERGREKERQRERNTNATNLVTNWTVWLQQICGFKQLFSCWIPHCKIN